jgi:hypothetical protein
VLSVVSNRITLISQAKYPNLGPAGRIIKISLWALFCDYQLFGQFLPIRRRRSSIASFFAGHPSSHTMLGQLRKDSLPHEEVASFDNVES